MDSSKESNKNKKRCSVAFDLPELKETTSSTPEKEPVKLPPIEQDRNLIAMEIKPKVLISNNALAGATMSLEELPRNHENHGPNDIEGANRHREDLLQKFQISSQDIADKSPQAQFEDVIDINQEEIRNEGKINPAQFSTKQRRFKKMVNRIKTNLIWKREMQEKSEHADVNSGFVVNHLEGESLSFNVENFRAAYKSYGGLNARARLILMKAFFDRTDEDLHVLKGVVDRLKCFNKYSRKVKHELARVISYETFDDGRVIIQQGHAGFSFYFIISGAVLVRITETDKKSGKTHHHTLGELTEGSSFGELALLHDIKRTATIVCKGTSEFLRVDKPDFDMVLKMSYASEWGDRLQMFKWIPQFRGWNMADLENCNHSCKTREYGVGEIIRGNTTETSDYVHFITSGQVRIVRDLIVMRQILPYNRTKLYLASEAEIKMYDLRNAKEPYIRRLSRRLTTFQKIPEKRLLILSTLGKGCYFGIGENLKNTYLITKDIVETLLVPRVIFNRHNTQSMLETMKEELNNNIPDDNEAFQYYIRDKKWAAYKKRVVSDVCNRKSIPNRTSEEDVPYFIRCESSQIDDNCL